MANDEPAAAPLSAVEIEAIRQRAITAEDGPTALFGAYADVLRLLATLDAYRAIVAAVAAIDPERETQLQCGVCGGYRVRDSYGFPLPGAAIRHAADCPVTRARALLAEPGQEPTDEI